MPPSLAVGFQGSFVHLMESKGNLLRDWKIWTVLLKGEWDLWDEVIEVQIEKYILRELFPQMPISFVIDLCGGGWGNLIPLPSPPHPYCFRVWMFPVALYRQILWDWSSGGSSLYSAMQFPEASLSDILTSSRFQNYIKMEDLSPPAEIGVTETQGKCCPALGSSCSYLSILFSD